MIMTGYIECVCGCGKKIFAIDKYGLHKEVIS